MRTALSCVAVSMLFLGIPRTAAADPMTIQLSRSVSVGAYVSIAGADVEGENQQSDADVLFTTFTASSGPFSATGTQSLSSRLSTDSRQFSGTGRTSATAVSAFSGSGTGAGGGGNVYIEWDFRLERAYLFDFDTTLARSSDDVLGMLRANLGKVGGSGFDPVFSHDIQTLPGGTIADHGRLEAGLYTFFFQSGAGIVTSEGTKRGVMDLNFALDLAPAAPVPEPGTMSLLGAGLFAIAGGLRRRRVSER